MNSGIQHADVGDELTKTEWLSQESHDLIHGTSFPDTPAERQLFYRDDEHKWYIYNGSAWACLQTAAIAKLDDIGDVSVPTPADNDLLYYDQATQLWKCRALLDADIPAAIARDSEVTDAITTHKSDASAHHARYADSEAVDAMGNKASDNPLHHDRYTNTEAQNVADTQVATHKADASAHHARYADSEAQAVADTQIATHAALTTGVHGAGTNHLALFGQPGIVVTRFVPKSVASYIWRGNATTDNSSFQALINGTPTATSVVYDNEVREASLPEKQATQAQWGKVILHNITRGNSRKITDVDQATNTITTESSSDDWADNDIITIGSQTCILKPSGHDYSCFFDVDISPQVPATAKAIIVDLFNTENSGASTGLQNSFGVHPFETYGVTKFPRQYASAAYDAASKPAIIPVVSQKMCIAMGAFNPVNASGMYAYISLIGYWE